MWLWVSHFPALCLSFPISKMGLICSTYFIRWKLNELIYEKGLVQCLVYNKYETVNHPCDCFSTITVTGRHCCPVKVTVIIVFANSGVVISFLIPSNMLPKILEFETLLETQKSSEPWLWTNHKTLWNVPEVHFGSVPKFMCVPLQRLQVRASACQATV